MNGTSKYTVWHYVGCGCAVLAALAALGVGGMIWFGYRTAQNFTDPAVREAKVQEMLGYDELPEGYHPGFALSIPFVMDMAMIGDRPLPSGDGMQGFEDEDLFEDRGFMFFAMRRFGGPEDVRGETDYDFDADRTIGEGEVEAGGATVRYTAKVGTMETGGEAIRSIASEMEIDCGDGKYRFAVWFERAELAAEEGAEAEAAPEGEATPAETAEAEAEPVPDTDPIPGSEPVEDFTGTPADEDALRAFLDHFQLCGT